MRHGMLRVPAPGSATTAARCRRHRNGWPLFGRQFAGSEARRDREAALEKGAKRRLQLPRSGGLFFSSTRLAVGLCDVQAKAFVKQIGAYLIPEFRDPALCGAPPPIWR
jgi:hypothetical protein